MTDNHDLATFVADAQVIECGERSEPNIFQTLTAFRPPMACSVGIIEVLGRHGFCEPLVRLSPKTTEIALVNSFDHFHFETEGARHDFARLSRAHEGARDQCAGAEFVAELQGQFL